MKDTLKLLLVSDIHLGRLIEHRPGMEAVALLEALGRHVQESGDFDAVVEMGDRVNNTSHEEDLRHAAEVKAMLDGFGVPVYSLLGNHDRHYLSLEENETILGIKSPYRSVLVKGFRLVFLNTADPVVLDCGGHVSDGQKAWLEREVEAGCEPKLVFGHHAIQIQNQEGNPFFADIRGQEYVDNRADVQKVLEAGSRVLAYCNGHVHWNHFAVKDNIVYASVASLAEAYPEFSHAPGRYSEMTVTQNGHIELLSCMLSPHRALGREEWN